jgi:hypothetical protein
MLNRDFKEFVALLNAEGVEYLVVGAYALAVHGRPRYTGDIDVWLAPTQSNAERVLRVLDRFGFGGLGLTRDDFTRADRVIQLGYPPARIDLLTGIDGVAFDDAYPRRVTVELAGAALSVIGVDDFKANKRATGRHKDLGDLESLESPDDDGR